MITIYFKSRTLTIAAREEITPVADERFLLKPTTDYDLSRIPYMMEENVSFQNLTVEVPCGMTEQEVFDKTFEKVTKINAGGGLVEDSEGKHLMIYRNGTWDLPKGMQEKDEDIKTTAIREVEEEAGVKAQLGPLLTVTRHAYRMYGGFFIKTTYWFKMYAPKDAPSCPQTEEGIEKCEWVTDENLDYRLANTYPSVLRVFEKALSLSGKH